MTILLQFCKKNRVQMETLLVQAGTMYSCICLLDMFSKSAQYVLVEKSFQILLSLPFAPKMYELRGLVT
jgi:hypothetical protein